MAADDTRRCRENMGKAGLQKVETWVPAKAKAPLKAIEAVLRGKKGDDALQERVLSRLQAIHDLITHATTPLPAAAFNGKDAVRGMIDVMGEALRAANQKQQA
ncbi:MAG: hypothetical protein H7Z12_19885 [Rhodospirillaceae bacterium]|nr:hypothetical protein [Rhodospirillales bacterium]